MIVLLVYKLDKYNFLLFKEEGYCDYEFKNFKANKTRGYLK